MQKLAWLFLLILLALPTPVYAQSATVQPIPTAAASPATEVEGVVTGSEENVVEADAVGITASIEGMTPLYQTKIKPLAANGTSIRMRSQQDGNSTAVCAIATGETITIYAVYPSYVLAEYQGNVGYVIRTWIDENCTPLNPATTPPYGVVLFQYVATLSQDAPVYTAPRLESEINEIQLGTGNKIAILGFVDGFAKILYWRSYGYVYAAALEDLVVVSPTDEPLGSETPIAAFSSYFAYSTGKVGNDGRVKNIIRSCEQMTRVLQPGEVLDFNADIGPYKRSNGYFPAPVLIDGGSQLGYGGGTCQSSSTLYNAVRQLPGITILKRRPHGPASARYLPMHQDAAVGSDEINFILRNDYGFPLRILAESNGTGSLCIQIFKN